MNREYEASFNLSVTAKPGELLKPTIQKPSDEKRAVLVPHITNESTFGKFKKLFKRSKHKSTIEPELTAASEELCNNNIDFVILASLPKATDFKKEGAVFTDGAYVAALTNYYTPVFNAIKTHNKKSDNKVTKLDLPLDLDISRTTRNFFGKKKTVQVTTETNLIDSQVLALKSVYNNFHDIFNGSTYDGIRFVSTPKEDFKISVNYVLPAGHLLPKDKEGLDTFQRCNKRFSTQESSSVQSEKETLQKQLDENQKQLDVLKKQIKIAKSKKEFGIHPEAIADIVESDKKAEAAPKEEILFFEPDQEREPEAIEKNINKIYESINNLLEEFEEELELDNLLESLTPKVKAPEAASSDLEECLESQLTHWKTNQVESIQFATASQWVSKVAHKDVQNKNNEKHK